MRVLSFAATDVGRRRQQNEDNYLVDKSLGLFMVCDGMGGHAAGDVASRSAVEHVAKYLRDRHAAIVNAELSPSGQYRVLELAEEALQYASSRLYQKARSDPSCAGMGTTLTLLLLVGNKGIVAHVGDTRLYLQRSAQLHLLTTDHTLANELILSGAMSTDEAGESNLHNVLTRSIGQQDSVQVETLLFDIVPGDVMMLCSDGLNKYVGDKELQSMLQRELSADTASRLVQLANDRGGADNITAILLKFQPDSPVSAMDPQELERSLETLQSVFLFQGLSLSRLTRVMNIASYRNCEAGEVVVSAGQKCDALYIVLAGRISDGATSTGPGGCLGVASLLAPQKLAGKWVAETSSRLLVIPGGEFEALTRRQPKLGARLLSQLARHLSQELQRRTLDRDQQRDTDTWPGA